VGNLVANAAAHGARDQPVTVQTESDASTFRITVHNHGQPIPPDVLPRLFAPMVRGADVTSKGVGLGLYIVREIVRAHGGRAEAESTAESGTRFILHIPRT
jgi:sigma-B regulation protein RsbU (phosphoserine phosphatase)